VRGRNGRRRGIVYAVYDAVSWVPGMVQRLSVGDGAENGAFEDDSPGETAGYEVREINGCINTDGGVGCGIFKALRIDASGRRFEIGDYLFPPWLG
jgi:hypothetical protein